MEKRIGFIGVGKMAQTIINGLVSTLDGINEYIYISNRTKSKGEKVSQQLKVTLCDDNVELVKECDIIFLSVKPHQYDGVIKEVRDFLREDQIIVTIAAGISIADVSSYFDKPMKIIRTMPNIAVTVGEGMVVATPSEMVEDQELQLVIDLLTSIGKVDVIEEGLIDKVTTISGCSPAFIAQFIEAMADGAVLQGVPRDKAYLYAAQNLIGTGKILLEKQMHPGELKDTVTSPGGVTIAGVCALEKMGLRSIVIEAMKACEDKIKELKQKE